MERLDRIAGHWVHPHFCCWAPGRKLPICISLSLSTSTSFERTVYFAASSSFHKAISSAAVFFIGEPYHLLGDHESTNEVCRYQRPWLQQRSNAGYSDANRLE